MSRLLLYLFFTHSIVTKIFADEFRVDCAPDGVGEIACHERKCSWLTTPKNNPQNLPTCCRAKRSAFMTDLKGKPNILLKFNGIPNGFEENENLLNASWKSIGSTLQVLISGQDSYNPYVSIPRNGIYSTDQLEYISENVVGTTDYAFQIKRQSTGNILFDTTIGGFFYAPQFIELTTYLPSPNIFGIGEHSLPTLKHDTSVYTTFTMLNNGKPDKKHPTGNTFGTHPFYLCLEKDGKAHGVLFYSSAPQEIVVGPLITYRAISGQLEMAFFPGPTPEEVIRQFHAYIGLPQMPPYWAFGFQYGQPGTTLQAFDNKVVKMMSRNIPLDAVLFNNEYQNDSTPFTIAKAWDGLPSYVRTLKSESIKTLLELGPTLPATSPLLANAIAQDVTFVSWENAAKTPKINDKFNTTKGTKIMLGGSSTRDPVAFLDFLDPLGKTEMWWKNQLTSFYQQIPFDGIVLNRNEPLNEGSVLECPRKNKYDTPPYKLQIYSGSHGELSVNSLCMEGTTTRSFKTFYDTRNLYGISQTMKTRNALNSILNVRSPVLSRSTFVSSGHYGGHWLDGKTATWDDLTSSITDVLLFNMFGIPFVGSDICGSTGAFTEDLCRRWFQLGTFHSLSRYNHDVKTEGKKDFTASDPLTLTASSSLSTKYEYLPYLYSLHHTVAKFGGTVMRPLFFEFPKDVQAVDAQLQFMWGSGLMVVPITSANARTVHTYFPYDTWYYGYGSNYGTQVPNQYYQDVEVGNTTLPHFYRGGNIIVTSSPGGFTTTETRLKPFCLKIADKTNSTSVGEIYWDHDNMAFENQNISTLYWQLTFSYNNQQAKIQGVPSSANMLAIGVPTIDSFEVFGYKHFPIYSSFKLNGVPVQINTQKSFYSPFLEMLRIETANLVNLNYYVTQSFSLTWTHQ